MARRGAWLLDLLLGRPDVRASENGEADTVSLYWPGEILIAVDILAQAMEVLRALGIRPRESGRAPGNFVVLRVPIDQTESLAGELCKRFPPGSCGLRHYFEGASSSLPPPVHIGHLPPFHAEPEAGAGVHIVVLDTGLPERLPAGLPATLTPSDEDRDPHGRLHGHGLYLASIVARIAPGSRIEVRRVLDRDGLVDELSLGEALAMTLRRGVDIVLLGLGGYTWNDQPPVGLLAASQAALGNDAVVVAAAGNDGVHRPFWPAAFPWVVAVGAVTERLEPAPFSNRGPYVNLWAPGMNVIGQLSDGPATWSGTSFAAAFVVGALAVRVSAGQLTAPQAMSTLLQEADSLSGIGRILRPGLD